MTENAAKELGEELGEGIQTEVGTSTRASDGRGFKAIIIDTNAKKKKKDVLNTLWYYEWVGKRTRGRVDTFGALSIHAGGTSGRRVRKPELYL